MTTLEELNPIIGAYEDNTTCGYPDCCGGPYPDIATVRYNDRSNWTHVEEFCAEVARLEAIWQT